MNYSEAPASYETSNTNPSHPTLRRYFSGNDLAEPVKLQHDRDHKHAQLRIPQTITEDRKR
jgi:hypothetical protein